MPLPAFLGKILSGGTAKVVDSIGTALDGLITNKEELAQAKLEIAKELNRHEEEMAKQVTEQLKSEDINVTDRWKADMSSDSWMSKNTRPLTMLSLLAFLYLIILSDSIPAIGFEVKVDYIDLLQILLTTVVVAYFGSRGFEKVKSMGKK